MFNRFDQAELPITDDLGTPLPFSYDYQQRRRIKEPMPETPLRPNDPAVIAANQTTDFGMPVPEPEPRRPFVPEYQPPNPVGDLMPLPGAGRGGATTRQNIPEDDNGDQQNGQSINPLSSIALRKLQDFEAQGVPQQNPKLWQKLLALAAGAGSVVAAMNAERVRPDTQALAGMTNSILYPNEERNRARWLDQRALLRDAVRSEQTGNENVLKQMELAQKAKVDEATINKLGAQAGMYASREDTNRANTELAKWKQNIENIIPKTTEELKTRQLWEASKSSDPKVRAAADAELTNLYETKIAKPKRIPAVVEAEVSAIADELIKADPSISEDDAWKKAMREYGKRSLETKSKQVEANLANTAARTERAKRPPQPRSTGQLTALQQQNSTINGIAAHYLNATKNPDTTLNHEAAIKGIEADATLDQAKKDAAVLAVQKMRRSKGSGDSRAFVDEFMIKMGGGKTPTPKVETPPTTQTSAVAAPTKQQPPKGTAKTIIKIDPKTGNMRTVYLDAKGKEITVY